MDDKYAKLAYKAGLIYRTRLARAASGLGQIAMGAALGGMDQGKYKQYETRTPMPTHLHEKFCKICGCTVEWLRDEKGTPPTPKQKVA